VQFLMRSGVCAALSAMAFGLAFGSVAMAQDSGQGGAPGPVLQNFGLIEGQVARCVNGAEVPARNVAVGIDGGSSQLAHTDDNGAFLVSLPPGQYTVIATADDGAATRPYVPVEVGEVLDIGILDIGGGLAGCGTGDAVTQPVLPTFTPTPTPTLEPPTATPTATPTVTPTPEATPMPDDDNAGSAGG
jgi:carboxypeptidase family protein